MLTRMKKRGNRMDINNKYTTEIALTELKIKIFESDIKKLEKNENRIIKEYFENIIQENKLHIKNLIYLSYDLEIESIYKTIEILEFSNSELRKEFITISNNIFINKFDYNLCEKLTEDLEHNIKKTSYNDDWINHCKTNINELKKEREEELSKWKQ